MRSRLPARQPPGGRRSFMAVSKRQSSSSRHDWPAARPRGREALCCSKRGVAQLGSAGALGALGRRFESCRPDLSHSKGSRGSGDPSFLGFWGPMCTSRAQNRFQGPGQSPPKASERALRRPGNKGLKAAQHRFASKPVLNQRQPAFDCGNSPARQQISAQPLKSTDPSAPQAPPQAPLP